MGKRKIKVLIVDDSLLFRKTLTSFLGQDETIEVVGAAGDPYEARDKILELKPDVLTLDVEMPKMNGITFLEKLIPQFPIPVVVVSALPINAFDALDAGAVDYVKKPTIKNADDLKEFCNELASKINVAVRAKVVRYQKTTTKPITYKGEMGARCMCKDTVIALGASTGGTEALQLVLKTMPTDCPPILIVQHMPANFTRMYAQRLDNNCAIEVKEAEDGDRLCTGKAIVAAGEFHLTLKKDAKGYYISSKQGNKVSGHCPSVDVLFSSVADIAGDKAVGVIMTGMGSDGAKGLLRMRKAGAYTIGQNKESCIVYGMPMVAFNIGAVDKQASLENITYEIFNKLNKKVKESLV